MKRILISFLSICLMLQLGLYAQERHFCGTDYINQELLKTSSIYRQARDKAAIAIKKGNSQLRVKQNTPYVIPVVVHVINAGDPLGTLSNPSDDQIINMINILNQSYSATYPGYPTVQNGGVDIGIQFQLAKRDPDCKATNGIVRINASNNSEYVTNGLKYSTSDVGLTYEDIANMSFWDNTQYLNIWLVNKIPGWTDGFTFFPTSGYMKGNGVYMEAIYIFNPYLVAHEIGHAFDLRHTFENTTTNPCSPNDDCAIQGDFVCDTDPHIEDITPCNATNINPCTNKPYGNLIYNYMNYYCYHSMFTQGQKERMLSALLNVKSSLLTSLGVIAPDKNIIPAITIFTNATNIFYHNVSCTATIENGGLYPSFIWKVNGVANPPNSSVSDNGKEFHCFVNDKDIVTCDLVSSSGCAFPQRVTSNALNFTVNNGSVEDKLVAYYPFDGDMNDFSGNSNNGVESSGISYEIGKIGQAVKFGGISNTGYIKVPNSSSLQFGKEASFVLWVRLDDASGMDGWGQSSPNGAHCLLAKDFDRYGMAFHLNYSSQNVLSSWLSTSTSNGECRSRNGGIPDYKLGSWIHIAYVFSATENTLYINGVKDTTILKPFDFTFTNTRDLYFGRYSSFWYPFNGALDEVRIYNKALSQIEVQNLYNSSTGITINKMGDQLSILPNPVKNNLIVKTQTANSLVKIFSINGSLVKTVPDYQSNSDINVSALKSGVYLLKIFGSDGKVYAGKFVKE